MNHILNYILTNFPNKYWVFLIFYMLLIFKKLKNK